MDSVQHFRQLDQPNLGGALRLLLREVAHEDQEVERRLQDEVRQDGGPHLPPAHGPGYGLRGGHGGHHLRELCRAPLQSCEWLPCCSVALHGLSTGLLGREQCGAVYIDPCEPEEGEEHPGALLCAGGHWHSAVCLAHVGPSAAPGSCWPQRCYSYPPHVPVSLSSHSPTAFFMCCESCTSEEGGAGQPAPSNFHRQRHGQQSTADQRRSVLMHHRARTAAT
mmetsp:Transcript_55046/g.170548  ORF Transcript_55046/g.170548 Transcript_55046/m.170548 type:complete len:222 (-) Transcript_55046:37-702(-)